MTGSNEVDTEPAHQRRALRAADQPAASPSKRATPWPRWARPQLQQAVELADRIALRDQHLALAPELYRTWFNPVAGHPTEARPPSRPLIGLYRSAHAGSSARVEFDGIATVDRHDVIGRDGWWRTWGPAWRPTQSRRGGVRLVMTPRPDALAELVGDITAALLDSPVPWMLACATDARRLRRLGGVVLHVPAGASLGAGALRTLSAHLTPTTPPLCLPLAPGIGLADNPDNGMSFGEHRCHLVAMALRARGNRATPLESIADVFSAHGIDPARPYVSGSAG